VNKFRSVVFFLAASFCVNSLAFDFFSKPATDNAQNTSAQSGSRGVHKPVTTQKRVGPVVSGMLDDGRDVPERFRGKKTAAQLRSEQAEQSSDELRN
jgi:hypothetical protein